DDIHRRSTSERRRSSPQPNHTRMGRGHSLRNTLGRLPLRLPSDESRHAMTDGRRIVIIGGGLAGMSAGHHLAEHDPIVFEKESAIGGLCRSFTQDGFTFDCTGHLIHLKKAETRELISRLLPDAFDAHERRASIYS